MKRVEKRSKIKEETHVSVRDVAVYFLDCKLRNVLTFVVVLISVSVVLFNSKAIQNRQSTIEVPRMKVVQKDLRSYKIYTNKPEDGYLKHVHAVLKRIGFEHVSNTTDWDLLWGHDYPFRVLYPELQRLKPHQKVNHFPGNGYITSKVELATSKLKYIPPAYKLPEQKQELLEYAAKNPEKTFVYKDNHHRNIRVKKIQDIDINAAGNFMQEYIDKPYLVDGYKFDIGVYTIITSIDPLRVYMYNGDVLFRFCMPKYHPFDPDDLEKYVVGDDYRPIWDVPSLKYYYDDLNFTMRNSFDSYVRSRDLDPEPMWRNVENAIVTAILNKEESLISVLGRYASSSNFFELMRFDFILDENLNVYLLEANMSPNLSSAHYPPNQRLYEQVLHNLFSLVGVGVRREEVTPSWERSLAVFPEDCSSEECKGCSPSIVCQLCAPCRTKGAEENLRRAYEEFVSRRECKRIFPPSMVHIKNNKMEKIDETLEEYSPENRLQYRWFLGKCLLDEAWC